MVAFFNLVRWKNLLLIVYIQLLLKFVLFSSFNIVSNLSLIQFILLLVSLLCITAAGYIINDIFDLKSDLLNKPEKVIVSKYFSKEKSQQLYKWINSIGIITGIGLALNLNKPSISLLFIGPSLLLNLYSKKLKSLPIIGNIVVSLLISFCILILFILDINTSIKSYDQRIVISIIFMLSFFAFFINLIREIIKDIEDVNGDYKLNMKTLPILIGRNRTKIIVLSLTIFPIGLLSYIIIKYSTTYNAVTFYLLFFSLLPMLFTVLKIKSAKSIKNYKTISTYLKIIMLLGITTLLVISINN